MKQVLAILVLFLLSGSAHAQNDKEQVKQACLNYIEGFYEGDTTKLITSLKPTLYKFGYWKDKNTGNYGPDGQMTYRQALDYATRVAEKKSFAKPGAPREVEVLDVLNCIASAKVKAWWGYDYILLAKLDNKWMIEQVLWEGPLQK